MAMLMNKRVAAPSVSARGSRAVCKAVPNKPNFGSVAQNAAAALAAGALLASPVSAAGVDFLQAPRGPVSNPVHLDFKVDGLAVKPVSEGLQPNSGHFHVHIDDGPFDEGVPIPFDATHLHYGKGQTSADVEVPQGTHKLTLQFANANHESYGPKYAKTIDVTVK